MYELFFMLTKEKRRVMLVCCLVMLGSGFLSLSIGSILPDMKSAYGLSDTQSGFLLSAHSIGNLAAGFISAMVFTRIGDRGGIVILSVLAYLGFFLSTLYGAPVYLIACFLLLGFGRGSITNYTTTTVNRITDGSPVGSNLLHSWFAIGAIITPMIFILLSQAFGWKLHVWVVAVYGAIVVFMLSRLDVQSHASKAVDTRRNGVDFLKKPAYLISVLMMFFYLCSEYSVNGFLVTYIQHKDVLLASLSLSGQTLKAFSQKMATLLWVAMLTGRILCAMLVRKKQQKAVMFFCGLMMVMFFMLMLKSTDITTLTVAVGGLGLGMSGVCPMIYTDAAEYCNEYRLANGFLLGLASIGSILMPSIVGSLADHFGFETGMTAVMIAFICFSVFAAINVCGSRISRCRGKTASHQ